MHVYEEKKVFSSGIFMTIYGYVDIWIFGYMYLWYTLFQYLNAHYIDSNKPNDFLLGQTSKTCVDT